MNSDDGFCRNPVTKNTEATPSGSNTRSKVVSTRILAAELILRTSERSPSFSPGEATTSFPECKCTSTSKYGLGSGDRFLECCMYHRN